MTQILPPALLRQHIGVTLTIARETGSTAEEITALEARRAQLLAAAASEDPMDVVEAWEDMRK